MLLVYELSSGDVLDNSGTNSMWPEGPPDDLALVNLPDVDPATVGLLRLHDINDADLVQQILAQRHHVDPASGQVVLDGPYDTPPEPDPVPEDPDLALEERVRSATTVNQLKAALLGDGSTVAVAARVKES